MASYKDVLDTLGLRAWIPLSGGSPWTDLPSTGLSYSGSAISSAPLITTVDPNAGSITYNSANVTGSDNAQNLLGIGDSMSFSMKCQSSTNPSDGYFMCNNSQTSFGFARKYVGGVQKIVFDSSMGSADLILNYVGDQIYHMVITILASGYNIYVDGVLTATINGTPATIYLNKPIRSYSHVSVGNLSIHDYEISAAEAMKLFTATKNETITINGTISESLAAVDFKVNAHRYDTGALTASTITNTGAFALDVPDIPHYVIAMAEQGVKHETEHVYTIGEKVYPDDMITYPFYYECTTAGTSGVTAPAWQTSVGSTTADATVIWTVVEHLIQPVAHSPILS